ncbi:hypothetical protein HPP92_022855 [Vanilla planifolia]|uniref:Uncharacterized protein n=1 Tax=Vanilla planifolia TaxID=51239 RepID=A0A835UFH8_VANPL|nr:hypothetical protein HPP92_022855 [Vanilla planifolia]
MDALREGDDKSSNSSLSRCQSFQVHEAENLAFCHFWGTRVNKGSEVKDQKGVRINYQGLDFKSTKQLAIIE